jgi:monovalent cation:H+ antiporter-2, CPA2 family
MEPGVVFVRDLAVVLLAAVAGGWLARRLGLSAVVGYLCAGLVVGTPEITFIQVSDPVRVQVLAQLGLVFLMFSIGLGVRLRELRALGIGPVLATVGTALFMLSLTRLAGGAMGMPPIETLFFAGMLMVSSSAIIGKLLRESNRLHERAGRLALSQTLLEDFVAVVLLTVLGSVAAFGGGSSGGGWAGALGSLGQLGAFVLLFVLLGLLLLPRLVRRIAGEAGEELHTIAVAAFLFSLALLTVLAGYSLALGAFLCGVLVAEIPRARLTERAFSGMRDVFTAVFFVAVGMAIDLSQTAEALPLIALGTLLAIVGRFVASAISWMLVCEGDRTALQAALFVTPIGEFSFIIAGLGVSTGALPERYQIVAVGIAFLTSLLGPAAMRQSERILRWTAPRPASRLRVVLEAYHEFWHMVARRGGSHLLWRFLRPRLGQVAREVVWITAVLLFARPAYRYLGGWVERASPAWSWLEHGLPWFWLLVVFLALPAFVALLRNLNALCLIVADYSRMQTRLLARLYELNLRLLRLLVYALVAFWVFNLLPWELLDRWSALGLVAGALAGTVLGWRRFIRLHGAMEVEWREILIGDEAGASGRNLPEWDVARREWGLQLLELRLPDGFVGAGQTLADLRLRQRTGANVVGIQRQGWSISSPGPESHLFPDDTVLLLGRETELEAAAALLRETEREGREEVLAFERAVLVSMRVGAESALCRRTLAELNWPRLRGVQVAAVRREGVESTQPGPDWELRPGDELLLLGSDEALRQLHRELEGAPGEKGRAEN